MVKTKVAGWQGGEGVPEPTILSGRVRKRRYLGGGHVTAEEGGRSGLVHRRPCEKASKREGVGTQRIPAGGVPQEKTRR